MCTKQSEKLCRVCEHQAKWIWTPLYSGFYNVSAKTAKFLLHCQKGQEQPGNLVCQLVHFCHELQFQHLCFCLSCKFALLYCTISCYNTKSDRDKGSRKLWRTISQSLSCPEHRKQCGTTETGQEERSKLCALSKVIATTCNTQHCFESTEQSLFQFAHNSAVQMLLLHSVEMKREWWEWNIAKQLFWKFFAPSKCDHGNACIFANTEIGSRLQEGKT